MLLEKRPRKLRLVHWPSDDWEFAPRGYRVIKTVFTGPIKSACRIRSKGVENVPLEGGVILAINHFTWGDPVLLGAILRRPAFYLAKSKLFDSTAFGWFFSWMGQIPVKRETGGNEAAVDAALELLKHGIVVGIFPEGTRSRYGELKRGKTGVARIAMLSGAPVVPVAITSAEFWPKHASLPRFGKKVYINIGEPMRFDEKPDLANDREAARRITDEVMGEVRRLLDEATTARDKGATEGWR